MKRTTEQSEVIVSPTQGLTVVRAYAGTGKTTSLVEYARERPGKRGLYLAFNKATQLDAARRFPASVLCKTIHAMAFAKFGRTYAHKLGADLRLNDVMAWLDLSQDYDFTRLVVKVLNAYLTSADDLFPVTCPLAIAGPGLSPVRSQYAAMMAKKLWTMMCDPASSVPMVHDGYLKLYQLSRPILPLDYIMLDEYQDTNPVTASIVLGQKCPRILVGDPYQGIYQFRGARNAMDGLQADQTFYLTHSFRFGPRIASLASRLLFEFFGETRPLVGRGPDTTIGPVDLEAPFTTLCRTNAEVFYRAVGASNSGKSLGFVGGVASYGFEMIYDAYRLSISDKRSIRDPFIRSFDSYTAYQQYASDSGDREAVTIQKVVATFGGLIPQLIDKIKGQALANFKDAQRVLSTAHKSKGMEFGSVVMADDFWDLIGPNGPMNDGDELNPEEVRLTYVALTRAIGNLHINSQLAAFARFCGISQTSDGSATNPNFENGPDDADDHKDSGSQDVCFLPLGTESPCNIPNPVLENPVAFSGALESQGQRDGCGTHSVATAIDARLSSTSHLRPSNVAETVSRSKKRPAMLSNSDNLSLF